MTGKDLLLNLSRGVGVSGYEQGLLPLIKSAFEPLVDRIEQDRLGNIIMIKEGRGTPPRPKVMLAAHMDEIGLIITAYEKGGFLRFSSIGGIDERILLGQEVVVHGRKDLVGVIGAKPPHIQEKDERKKTVKMEDLFIDVGLEEETCKQLVAIGDMATLKQDPVLLSNDRYAGKALDDRAGIVTMLLCLQLLENLGPEADVYLMATVQEEVGVRGATTGTYGIVPDIGIALDVGHGDIPGLPEHEVLPLGKGPGIGLGPHVHPAIYQRFTDLAEEWGISYTPEPGTSPAGTDAYAIQITQGGIPTGLISLPLRYMHTPVETLHWPDLEAAARLLAMFICSVDRQFVEGLRCF